MYVKRNYGFWMTVKWSKMPFIIGFIYASVIVSFHVLISSTFTIPWQIITVLGIAVAFYLGFKNNSSYDRTWEARKIWGAIVNHSRSFASAVLSFVQIDDPNNKYYWQKRLIYRHIAWLTALRHQLRLEREWEHKEDRLMSLYIPNICEAYFSRLDHDILQYIDRDELEQYKSKSNMASQLLITQMKEITDLYKDHWIDGFQYKRMHEIISFLYDDQGMCERIKNFPFPRQYASTALWLTFVFCAVLPFGVLNTFENNGMAVWMAIPISALTTWVFFLMEKIGDYSENPFEGTYNDVPITSIARAIEIDLREMLNDEEIPKPVQAVNGFLL
ncbi:MAG TPA: bestrophin family ion channel [Saprospiraceae bacterium]|nr:bestrophin family ion channel [Saprospiraceae bacterium]